MKGTAQAIIERPVEDVWSFITDVPNLAQWAEEMSDTVNTSDGDFGEGSTFASKYTYRGKTFDVDYRVSAFVPTTLFRCESTKGPFPMEFAFDLQPSNGGTAVTNTVEVGSDHVVTSLIFTLAGPLIRRGMEKHLREELEALKSAVEGSSPSP